MKTPKVLIVGLDSATFDLARPWIDEGKLPSLAALMKNGAWGGLASVVPPITPPAWTSFMTGKNPGKHGIFHFLEASPGRYGLRYLNAGSRRAKTIWRILSDAGYAVGTINIPFTYPPEQLSGFQISGMDTPSEKSSFIYPPELRSELEGLLGRFKLDLRYLGYMTTDPRRHEVLAEMEKLDRQWLGASLYLMRKHPADVMMVTFMSIDTVQHYFWQYMDRNHHLHDSAAAKHFGDAILRVYQRLDDAIGQLLRETSSGTSVFIVSDHGGGPTSDRVVYLNRYLAHLGLLYYREDKSSALEKLRKKIVRGSYTLLRNALSSGQKSFLAYKLPALRKRFETAFTSFSQIDWTRTKAYCSEVLASPPSIWINLKGVKPFGIVERGEYESLLEFIRSKLRELKDPRTNEPVIKRIFRRDEIFHGPFSSEAADLILDWWEESEFSTSPSFPEDTERPAVEICERKPSKGSEWGGTHRRDGILIAQGKPFKKGTEIHGAQLIDLAPTLLYLLGQPVPEDMDGLVLRDLFEPAFLLQNPTRSGGSADFEGGQAAQYSEEEAAIVEERLAALGYIE
jgi:predicted AlkP superfamily phosphohydrolase/phosphomutase